MKIEKMSEKMVCSDATFTKRVIFNEEKSLNSALNLKQGQEIPPHTHENSDLIVYVITGEGELTVDGKAHNITTGDVVYYEGNERFCLVVNLVLIYNFTLVY